MRTLTQSNDELIKGINQMFDRYKNFSSCDTRDYLLAGRMLNDLQNRLSGAHTDGVPDRDAIIKIYEEANKILVNLQIP